MTIDIISFNKYQNFIVILLFQTEHIHAAHTINVFHVEHFLRPPLAAASGQMFEEKNHIQHSI